MKFLLDTNIVSEWVKPRPNPGVIAWLTEVDEDRVFLSVVSLIELRYGVERLPPGKRRNSLHAWLENDLPLRFEKRFLPIDESVADACGKLTARNDASGKTMSMPDALIAATAQAHKMTLVTRNVSDFASSMKTILNPWTDTPRTQAVAP